MKIFYCIFGASGHGKVIVEILENLGHSIRELYDDDVNKKKLLGYNVTNDPYIFNLKGVNWIIGIGNNKVRKQVVENHSFYYGTAIDNYSQISKRAEIGPGTVIMPGVSVNASTLIGKHAIINTNASVDHDCFLGDYVHISPNATLCGGVNVDEGTHVGAGAVIIPGVHIGKWATIGAGSVIIKDVPNHVTVVGNPGKVIKSHYLQ